MREELHTRSARVNVDMSTFASLWSHSTPSYPEKRGNRITLTPRHTVYEYRLILGDIANHSSFRVHWRLRNRSSNFSILLSKLYFWQLC